jgi:hypothetical protein
MWGIDECEFRHFLAADLTFWNVSFFILAGLDTTFDADRRFSTNRFYNLCYLG